MDSHVRRALRLQQHRELRCPPTRNQSSFTSNTDPTVPQNQSHHSPLPNNHLSSRPPLVNITNRLQSTPLTHSNVLSNRHVCHTNVVTPPSSTAHSARRTFEIGEASSTTVEHPKKQRTMSRRSIPVPLSPVPDLPMGSGGMIFTSHICCLPYLDCFDVTFLSY